MVDPLCAVPADQARDTGSPDIAVRRSGDDHRYGLYAGGFLLGKLDEVAILGQLARALLAETGFLCYIRQEGMMIFIAMSG